MDKVDSALISLLRHDARASLSELAGRLGVARGTVRSRLARLHDQGDVLGYSVVLKGDVLQDPVRALMMIAIEGRGTEKIMRQLSALVEVRRLHSTNGRWDVITEIGTDTLEHLDDVLSRVRRFEGVTASETSLLLSTRKSP